MADQILRSDNESDPEEFSTTNLSADMTQVLQHDDPSLKLFDKSIEALTVVDVYNIASSVGQEFERLTDAFGGVVFCGVMPKIIRILEMLETLVTIKEKDTAEVTELNHSLQILQKESKLKDAKQQEEIDIVESSWKDETRSLLESLSSLEEDNQKLTLLLSEKLQEDDSSDIDLPDQASLITKLQQQISQQRDDIRSKNASLEERAQEIDALQMQIERLSQLNGNIRNKMYIYEQQAKSLIEEKAGLEAKLSSNGRNMAELQLKSLKQQKSVDLKDEEKKDFTPTEDFTASHLANLDPLVANKLIIDLNDPNRPRYTLQELQEVLTDRNQLKARCFLLEEELIYHRGEDNWVELDENEIRQSKLHSSKQTSHPQAPESGVRRFFQYLAGDSTWRHRAAASKPQTQSHRIVDDDITGKDFVNPNDIKELVPQPNRKCDVTKALDPDPETIETEMNNFSPTIERDDLSP